MKAAILTDPNPQLHETSEPIAAVDAEVQALLDTLQETLYASGGIGLAAPQIGVLRRAIVVDLGPEGRRQPYLCVNPRITRARGTRKSLEGCLSIPGKTVEVDRADSVDIQALDRNGRSFRLRAQGLLAACFQHEIDHLDGRLLTDGPCVPA